MSSLIRKIVLKLEMSQQLTIAGSSGLAVSPLDGQLDARMAANPKSISQLLTNLALCVNSGLRYSY